MWFALTWSEWWLYLMDLECIECENLGLYSVLNAKSSLRCIDLTSGCIALIECQSDLHWRECVLYAKTSTKPSPWVELTWDHCIIDCENIALTWSVLNAYLECSIVLKAKSLVQTWLGIRMDLRHTSLDTENVLNARWMRVNALQIYIVSWIELSHYDWFACSWTVSWFCDLRLGAYYMCGGCIDLGIACIVLTWMFKGCEVLDYCRMRKPRSDLLDALTCIARFALRLYAAKQNSLFQESCIQGHSDLMYWMWIPCLLQRHIRPWPLLG